MQTRRNKKPNVGTVWAATGTRRCATGTAAAKLEMSSGIDADRQRAHSNGHCWTLAECCGDGGDET